MMRFLTKKQVKERTIYSDAQRTRLEAAGKFPKRVRLGTGRYCRVGYVETEVDDWCEAQLAKRATLIALGMLLSFAKSEPGARQALAARGPGPGMVALSWLGLARR